jgi:hypothetical protein
VKSTTLLNLRVGVPQFWRGGLVPGQYFKYPNPVLITKTVPGFLAESNLEAKRSAAHKTRSMNTLMKRTILLMIAIVVSGCATNHREARRKSVQLYPGLPQREVVSLFGMPNKAQGNPDEGNPSGDYDERRQGSGGKSDFQHRTEDELVWEYDKIDLKITFRHAQAGWVVKTWSID